MVSESAKTQARGLAIVGTRRSLAPVRQLAFIASMQLELINWPGFLHQKRYYFRGAGYGPLVVYIYVKPERNFFGYPDSFLGN